METFAREKEAWFRRFLELANGIPSHDTLSDVAGRLAPGVFAGAFLGWARSALPGLAGEQTCLDGKALCGSRGKEGAAHLLSAYAAQARLVPAQQAVDGKSNETTALPPVLGLLELEGAVVSVDAMDCQKVVADKVNQAGADYVLALKDNHPQLREDVGLWLDTEAGKGALAVHETVAKGHGRIEIRRYALSDNLDRLAQKQEWAGLRAAGRVESARIVGGQASTEAATTWVLWPTWRVLRTWCAGIGPSRPASTGCWTLQFGEDARAAPAKTVRRRTWAWCGAWP